MGLAILLAAAVVAVAPVEQGQGITGYPAGYFASLQPTTALDMVSRLPGFTFDSGANVRGFGGAAGNVVIDGERPATKSDTLDDILKRIPADAVLRIDLIRGGAPGVDMQGKTILANVIRRKDRNGQLKIAASATRQYEGERSGFFSLDGERRFGQTTVEGSLAALRFIDSGFGGGTWRRRDGSGALIIDGREHDQGYEPMYTTNDAIETPVLGGKLKLNVSLIRDGYSGTQNDRLLSGPGGEATAFAQKSLKGETGLRYERAFGPKWSVETYLLQQLSHYDEDDAFTGSPQVSALTGDDLSNDFQIHRRNAESIARVTIKNQPSSKLSLRVGGEFAYNWLRVRQSFVENGALVPLPAARVRVAETRGEGFADATWNATPRLTAEAGVRVEESRITSSGDVVSERSLFYPKPRLQLTWAFQNGDQIRFRAEREVSQLNFDDFTAQAANLNTGTVHTGNPTLNPYRQWVLEAALEHKFWGKGDLSLTASRFWRQDATDRAPVFTPSGVFDEPSNIGSATGEEIKAELTLPTDRFALKNGLFSGSVTARHTRVTDPTTGVGRPLSDDPDLVWEGHFNQPFPTLRSDWGVDIQGGQTRDFYRFNELDHQAVQAYSVLFWNYKPSKGLTVTVQWLNFLGQHVVNDRLVYTNLRGSSPIAFDEIRDTLSPRLIKIRVVKIFS